MKKGWEWKRIDEVCDFVSGLWKGEKPPLVRVGVIRNTNFTREGTLDRTDIAQIEVEQKKLEKRRLRYGDIILEKPGGGPKQPVGRVALFEIADGEFSFSNFTSALRVRDTGNVNFRYVHKCLYWLYQSGVTESMQTNSTGIRNLNADAYKSLTIPIPPLPEQQRIVGILDEAFAGLATAEANAARNLQNAREIFDSHLQAVFSQRGEGWVETTMEHLIESALIGLTRSSKEQSDDKPYPYVKMNHITRDSRFEFLDYVTVDATKEEADRYRLEEGDFLFNTRNSQELVGKSCIYSPAVEGVVLYNNNIMRIRFKPGIDPRFILSSFASRPVAKELEAMKSGTTNVFAIYFKDLRDLSIPLPPVHDQKRIADELEALAAETQRLTQLTQQKQAALAALKKSLLHCAFSGEL